MWLATNVSDTLDSYTVIAWWLCDCLWDMTHCFQLAGITLLWIAGVKISWEIPQLQCILAHMIGENFHHILGHWLSCCASHLCNTVQGHCTVHQISTRQPGWEAINSVGHDEHYLKYIHRDVFGISCKIPCDWDFHSLWNSYYLLLCYLASLKLFLASIRYNFQN